MVNNGCKFAGRTGRFGRKGIAINFVHNQKTWQEMRAMEEALGMSIACIDTKDFDVMEEVSVLGSAR
jgi:ATP-dependent RNA helicase DDX19/DBP5